MGVPSFLTQGQYFRVRLGGVIEKVQVPIDLSLGLPGALSVQPASSPGTPGLKASNGSTGGQGQGFTGVEMTSLEPAAQRVREGEGFAQSHSVGREPGVGLCPCCFCSLVPPESLCPLGDHTYPTQVTWPLPATLRSQVKQKGVQGLLRSCKARWGTPEVQTTLPLLALPGLA